MGHDGPRPSLISIYPGAVIASPTNGTFNRLTQIGTLNNVAIYRRDFRHEKMRQIRMDNIGQIEAWPAGAPEIKFHKIAVDRNNPSQMLETYEHQFTPNRRRDIKNTWWNAEDVELHLWDYSGTGTKTRFAYYEYDYVLIPNEAVRELGGIVVDLITLASPIDPNVLVLSGTIRSSVQSAITALKSKNGMSEYIGNNTYSIFNDADQFNHSPGSTKFKTWPDL